MTMMRTRRLFLSLALALPVLVAGCAAPGTAKPEAAVPAAARAALAPTGTLRVGVYPGSPTSLVVNAKTGERAGVALELGQALGQQLGVPVQVLEFNRLALVLEALKAGQVDFSFTNATEARARDMDFTPALVQLELGYLVMGDSPLTSVADIDRPGMRIGVSQGSTSQGRLARELRHVSVIPAPSLKQAQQMLQQRQIDAFATNKGILFEMSDELAGSRVLDGRWGLENLAIAIPKGREAGLPLVRTFAEHMRASGQLKAIVQRAGLRGTTDAP